jgi:hypothetical protein
MLLLSPFRNLHIWMNRGFWDNNDQRCLQIEQIKSGAIFEIFGNPERRICCLKDLFKFFKSQHLCSPCYYVQFSTRPRPPTPGQPSDQINNQIYQSDQSIQIRYRTLSDQSTQIQASIHLIYLIFLAQRVATLELPDHPFIPAPQREALSKKYRSHRGQPS